MKKKKHRLPKRMVYELQNGQEVSKYDVLFNSIDTNNTQMTLSNSQYDKGWTNPGEFRATFRDNGNGVIILMENKEIKLDYEQVQILRTLLEANEDVAAFKRPNIYPTNIQKFKSCN